MLNRRADWLNERFLSRLVQSKRMTTEEICSNERKRKKNILEIFSSLLEFSIDSQVRKNRIVLFK